MFHLATFSGTYHLFYLYRTKYVSLHHSLSLSLLDTTYPSIYRQVSGWSAIKYFALVSDDVSHLWQLYHCVLLLFSYIQSILAFLTFIGWPQLQQWSFVHHLTVTFRNEPHQIEDTISIYQLHLPFLPLSHFNHLSLFSLFFS